MPQAWSTADVAERDRLEYWREVVCRNFVNLDVVPAGDGELFGRVRSATLGPLRASFVEATPMQALRTSSNIAKLNEDDLIVALHVRGNAAISQDGRDAALGPGDFTLFDATRPYRLDFVGDQRHLHLVLQFPRAMLEERTGHTADLTGLAVGCSGGAGLLASHFLVDLARQAPSIGGPDAPRLATHAMDLIALALDPADVADRGDVRLRRIKRYIEERLADPDLTPESVAAAHHMSSRSLYNLFRAHEEIPVGAWIQQRRFARIRQDLRDPRQSEIPVAAIGRRHGVGNPAYLSRDYRRRFSVSPAEERMR